MTTHVEHVKTGHVGTIRLIDERRRNALSNPLRNQLEQAFDGFAGDPEVRCIYLTGRGPTFCGGGDLDMMLTEGDPWSSHQRFTRSARWLTAMLRSPKPIVVGVNGVAVGGGVGLALVGDLVFAARDNARFMAGFHRLGLIPDLGTMYLLPRLVGMARARSFVYQNQTWSAEKAVEFGMITDAVPDDELDEHGMSVAQALAAGPAEGFGLTKQLMGRAFELGLDDMLMFEDLGQSLAYATEAVSEGVAAIRERRSPDFLGAAVREASRRRRALE